MNQKEWNTRSDSINRIPPSPDKGAALKKLYEDLAASKPKRSTPKKRARPK